MEFLRETFGYGIVLSTVELIILIISAFFYNNETDDLMERACSFLKFILAFIVLNITFIGILNYR